MTEYVAIVVAVGVVGIILGYLLARLDAVYTMLRDNQSGLTQEQRQPTSFFTKERRREQADVEEKIGQISIDSSKFVTDIRTDNIKRLTDTILGKTTTQQDTINQSVSKLAQLKGKE
jgi:predicted Holliday junction resolvase-like endonuclease